MTPRGVPAVVGIATTKLRHNRTRTILAVIGVTLAVLATILLVGTGIGVVETGQQQFDRADRDLWITGGPVQFAPTQPGGVRNSVYNAHELSAEMRARDDVRTASPLLFQTVYVSNDGESFETLAAMGVRGAGGVSVSAGRGFVNSKHYAGGTYDGPRTHELLIDQRTATLLDVDIGDTVYIGGTLAGARETQYTVVGVSDTGNQFLGAPTVTVPLSELQSLTGKTATDPATLLTLTTPDGISAETVESRLQESYPEYDVRTNREQLQATIERQAVVIAGGVSLILLAIVAGLALTLNILLTMVYQQLPEYAALKALGTSATFITGTAVSQALVIGSIGTAVGTGLAFPFAAGLNALSLRLTGFEGVVRLSPRVLAIGALTALVMTLVSAVITGWRISRLDPSTVLES
ncbi:ABC transporter permease [Halorubrum halophilum]|uniref:ABC transporter permease n=1 Tax=Halorubrum halophilum TaxID=413816 RepID=UPI00186B12FF|nr:ABC transporter permease [Halorubrum halophilum]